MLVVRLVGRARSAASCEPAKGKVTLQYWNTVPGMDKVVALWNKKNPNIQVETKNISNDQYGTIGNALKAGKAPDLAQVGYDELPNLRTQNAFVDASACSDGHRRQVEVRAVDLVADQLRRHRRVRLPAGHRPDGPLRAQRHLQEARPRDSEDLGRVRGGRAEAAQGGPRTSP